MTNGAPLTQKWLLGILVSIVLAGGAGWMTYVQAQIGKLATDQASEKFDQAKRSADLEVIKEKVKRLEEDTKEIKQDGKDTGKKIDELLRRSR